MRSEHFWHFKMFAEFKIKLTLYKDLKRSIDKGACSFKKLRISCLTKVIISRHWHWLILGSCHYNQSCDSKVCCSWWLNDLGKYGLNMWMGHITHITAWQTVLVNNRRSYDITSTRHATTWIIKQTDRVRTRTHHFHFHRNLIIIHLIRRWHYIFGH